ncbi:MAG: amidase [Vicinamibacterales bacterium]
MRPVWPMVSLALVLSVTSIPSGVTARQATDTFALNELTIAQVQAGLADGRYTSRQLVELYLRRIAAIDRAGAALHSVSETNPEALAISDALDAERKSRGPRGPLHGVPILIKDNIDTADRMTTTAGSLALEGSIAARDAFVVRQLRAAGAILLGKTNLSEWANYRSTSSSSGWSGRGGQVRNPYVLDRNPCGSSSGTGAAIAANLATAGVGTETDGSIVCPSGANGLVGLKPTVGLVSRTGIIPISHTQDTAGPMTRSVADAAAVLAAMVGRDPLDPSTTRTPAAGPVDYLAALDPAALKGARIGVARKRYTGYSPPVDRVFEAALTALRAQGAVIIDPADIPTAAQLDDCEGTILAHEFKADLNAYLKALPPTAGVHSLAEVIAFNQREQAREMPYFGQELFIAAQKKGPLTTPVYRQALATCRTRARALGIDAVLRRLRLDALVAPTGGPAWTTDLVNGDHFAGASSTPAAVAGYPSITVPAGEVYGLPVGLSFIGPAWSERRLLGLAFAFERATNHRRPPRFLPVAPM